MSLARAQALTTCYKILGLSPQEQIRRFVATACSGTGADAHKVLQNMIGEQDKQDILDHNMTHAQLHIAIDLWLKDNKEQEKC